MFNYFLFFINKMYICVLWKFCYETFFQRFFYLLVSLLKALHHSLIGRFLCLEGLCFFHFESFIVHFIVDLHKQKLF